MSQTPELPIIKGFELDCIPEIPFDKMQVGDAVQVPVETENDIQAVRQRVYRRNQKKGRAFFSVFKRHKKDSDELELVVYRRL